MINLNNLAAEIHEAAVKKGFWNVEDAKNKHLAKMISELGEVVQADRAGVMYEIEREGAKPEGVVAELADFAMMTMDLCIALRGAFPDEDIENWNTNESVADELGDMAAYQLVSGLAAYVIDITNAYDTGAMLAVIYAVYMWLRVRGFDLWTIIRAKMAYNESRPALHGRRY